MKLFKNYILTFLLLLVFTSNAQILYDNAFGTTDWDAANDMIITNDNHYMLLGRYYQNVYLAKVDTTAQLLWEKSYYNGSINQQPNSICEVGDSSFVIGGVIDQKSYLLKIDVTGDSLFNLIDTINLGNTITKCLQAPDGNLIVLAYFNSGFYSVVKLDNELNIISKVDTITTIVKDVEVINSKIFLLLEDSINNLLIINNNLTQIDTINVPIKHPDYLVVNYNKTSFVVEGRDSASWYLPHKMIYMDLVGNINFICDTSWSGVIEDFRFYDSNNSIININYYYSNPWGQDIQLEFTDSCMQVLYDTTLYRGGTVLNPEWNEFVKKVLIDPNGNIALYISGDEGPIGQTDLFLLIYKPWDGIITSTTKDNYNLSSENTITIYPNPTQNQFTVSGLKNNSSIVVMDVMGKVIYQHQTPIPYQVRDKHKYQHLTGQKGYM